MYSRCSLVKHRQHTGSHIKWHEQFHQKYLRCILNMKWHSLILDTVVLQRSEFYNIETKIVLNQNRWAGHVVRMGWER